MDTSCFASVVLLGLVFSFFVGNVAFSNAVAESGIGKDVFKVVVSLYGITDSTKDILTIVNVGDETKVKLYNAENPNSNSSDKVSYVFTFPNMTVEDGQTYTVCTMSTDNFNLKCENSKNSPLNRPEFVDVNASENTGEKEK